MIEEQIVIFCESPESTGLQTAAATFCECAAKPPSHLRRNTQARLGPTCGVIGFSYKQEPISCRSASAGLGQPEPEASIQHRDRLTERQHPQFKKTIHQDLTRAAVTLR